MLAALPSFLNTLPAAIAAGIVVPSLLLLYFLKLRRREMLISSTLLWKKAIQDLQVNAPFQRLRKNLLLFLQLLLLLLLALAFARPVMNYSPGAGKLAVIAIDRSASMAAADVNGHSRIEEAKRLARELVDTMDKDSSAMIIAFDDGADIVRSFTNDRALLKQSINGIQLTDRRSRLDTAFRLAEAKAAAFYSDQLRPSGVRPELWVYSDGRVLDRNELTLRMAELKFVKIGSETAENVAIVALNARRNYERPTEVQVFARLANFGPKQVSAVLQLSVNGQVVPHGVKRDLLLIPERWTQKEREDAEKQGVVARDSVEFNLELLTAAFVSVQIKEVARDMLTADDTAHVIVPPDATVLVEGRPAPLIVLHREGRNTHLAFGFDVGDTTSPTTKSFPLFLDNALQFMALGSDMDLRASYQPGATPKIPRYNLQQVNAKKIEMITPDDRTLIVNVPETGDFALPPLEKVGVYKLQP